MNTDSLPLIDICQRTGLVHSQVINGVAEQKIKLTYHRGQARYSLSDAKAVAREIKAREKAVKAPSAEVARAALSVRQRLDAKLASIGRRASGGTL
jgi:hypothetical protein